VNPRVFSLFLSLAVAACAGADDPPTDQSALPVGAAGGAGVPDRYVSRVVSFTPGKGAGFGQDQLPGIVEGPPAGTGNAQGSLDTLSLGAGGEIVVELASEVIDGPGVDLVVFENAFFANGNPATIWKELGEVSVSGDGEQWVTFPCDPAHLEESHCAGWHPVYAGPASGVSALDVEQAGGDPFDLATVGLARARYVKIRDLSAAAVPPTAGFDLDAVAVIHAAP